MTSPPSPVPGERCVHCGQTPSDPGASMCQIDGVSTGKLHDFRPGGGAGQRPGGWVEGIGWVALGGTLVSGDEYRIGVTQPLAMRRDEPMSPDWTDVPVVVVRWADGTEPDEEDEQHALAAPPSTPAEQPRPWNRKNCESCGISFARCTDRLAEHGACCARCHTTDTHDDLRPPSSGTDAAP